MIIIRCYKKDELNALVCHHSMRKAGIKDLVIFHYDNELGMPSVEICGTLQDIRLRQPCGNFGGYIYVSKMMEDFQKLPIPSDHEYVLYCDADVIFTKNPFDFIRNADHAGICGDAMVLPGIQHVSGQVNIVKGWLWNKYITEGEKALSQCHAIMVKGNSKSGCADDTLFSIYSIINKAKKYCFSVNDCWIHDKWEKDKCYEYLKS